MKWDLQTLWNAGWPALSTLAAGMALSACVPLGLTIPMCVAASAVIGSLLTAVWEHREQQKAAARMQHSAPSGSVPSALPDREFLDVAMRLLSMQQTGQRLSSQLDLRSLVAAIQNTAKEVLHCGRAALYLWNAHDSRLVNATWCAAAGEAATVLDEMSHGTARNAVLDWLVANRRVLTRRDAADGKLTPPLLAGTQLPTAVAPLLVGNELIGLLEVDDVEDESPNFVRRLFILASHCALGLKNAQLFRHIEEMVRRDSLTGLLNHATFLDELERLIDDAQANQQPLTVVMSDVDHFKNVNDTHGHQAGDHVLTEIARWWQAIMPDHAVLARYGGEEFICALPGEDLQRGRELAELLRASLENNPVSHYGKPLPVTASFGVAQLNQPANNVTRLIRLADKALYRAKEQGRNLVECHDVARPEIAAMGESTQFVMPRETPIVNF